MILECHATPGEVMRAVEALQEFGQARQVPEKALFGLSLALEECGSNIVNHALQGDARKKFKVRIEHTGSQIVLELFDHGPEFDPLHAHVEDTRPDDDDDRLPGGWGIQLIRKYMDDVTYRREDGQNVLRLAKNVAPAGDPK